MINYFVKRFSLRSLLFGLVIFSLSACLQGCSRDDDRSDQPEKQEQEQPEKQEQEQPQITPEITLPVGSEDYFTKTIDFDANGGEKVVTFTTNVPWNINISSTPNTIDWCTFSPQSGDAGTISITIKVKENDTFDDRNAVLVIKAGDLERRITINQKQQNGLTLTANRFEVPVSGGEVNIEVKSNINYEIEIPSECQEWVHLSSGIRSRALSSSIVTLKVDASQEYDKRQADIIIKSGDKREVATIYQAGDGILTLSKNKFDLDNKEQDVSIEINSNFDYDVDIPNVGWISEVKARTRGVSTHTLRLHISENKDYEGRSASVTISDKHSKLAETITITQNEGEGLILTTNNFEVPVSGGDVKIEVKSNIKYDVEIPSESQKWVHLSSGARSRSLSSSFVSLKVDASQEYSKRQAEIIIKSGELREVATITQAGEGILTLSQNKFNLDKKAQDISIEINSNFDYDVDIPNVGWISESKARTRGVSKHTLKLHIAENKAYEERTATVTVSDKNSNLSKTISINQAANTYLTIDNKSFSFDENGGEFSVEVQSNVDYMVKINAKWISESTSSKSKTHKFKVDAMSDNQNRETTIEFYDTASNLSEKVSIKQSRGIYFDVTEMSLMEGSKGKVTLTNNTGSSVTFSSSKPSVATVDASGNITAKTKGTTVVSAVTADNKHKCECTVTVKDVTDFIMVAWIGGSMMSTNNLIQYGSKLNWQFTNNSSATVTLKSLQLIDGETKEAGNEMSVNATVKAGESVAYSTTIGLLGIHIPVTCRFRYSVNGKSYSADAVYKGGSWW